MIVSSASTGATEDEIKSGKFHGCYLLYNRKSTDDLDIQKNSIRYQKAENLRFAERQGLEIAQVTLEKFCKEGVVSERHSAFKEDLELSFGEHNTVQYRVERPKFHQLAHWVSKGYFKGFICLCWDRASRNRADDAILRKLMKAGVDIRFAFAQYDKTSSGELHMDIDSMFAEHHSRVTREKVTLSTRNKRAQGVCTYRAPVGYLNVGIMENKPVDPERATVIKRLFELAATGEWSLADLARWAVEHGFTMPPMRRRRTEDEMLAEEEDDTRVDIEPVSRLPTFNTIHKILTNRFYTGRILKTDGTWVASASHEALVDDELFEKVEAQLGSKNTSAHYADFLDHPLRGLVRCADCKRVYTPYCQKGRTYFGARCRSGCVNSLKSFNFDFMAKKVGMLIETLAFTEDELVGIEARASTDIALVETRRLQRFEATDRRKKRLREDLAYLNAHKLSLLKAGVYTPEGLAKEEATLNRELNALCAAEQASDLSMMETVKEVVRLSELLKAVVPYYIFAEPSEKEDVIRIIFSELTLSEKTFDYKCKKGFQALANRFVASGDPIGWLSELRREREAIATSVRDLQAVCAKHPLSIAVQEIKPIRRSA